MDMEMTQEIVTGQITEYQPFRNQVADLMKTNAAMVFDYESAKGEKEANSYCYKLTLCKGVIEKTRKKIGADSLNRTRLINDEAKPMIIAIDAMIEVHMKPLRDKAKREAKRVADIEEKIRIIKMFGEVSPSHTSEMIDRQAEHLEAIKVDDSYGERKDEAYDLQTETLTFLYLESKAVQKREADAAELAELRAQQAKQAEIGRVAEEERQTAFKQQKLKDEAAAQAKIDAEAVAQKTIDAAQALAAKAKADADKVIADAKAAHDKRVADKKKADDLEAARTANVEHRKTINNTAKDALVAIGLTDDIAMTVVRAIASGEIPHVTVNY